MNVYKFGGASVKDADGVKNLFKIINTGGRSRLRQAVCRIATHPGRRAIAVIRL